MGSSSKEDPQRDPDGLEVTDQRTAALEPQGSAEVGNLECQIVDETGRRTLTSEDVIRNLFDFQFLP